MFRPVLVFLTGLLVACTGNIAHISKDEPRSVGSFDVHTGWLAVDHSNTTDMMSTARNVVLPLDLEQHFATTMAGGKN